MESGFQTRSALETKILWWDRVKLLIIILFIYVIFLWLVVSPVRGREIVDIKLVWISAICAIDGQSVKIFHGLVKRLNSIVVTLSWTFSLICNNVTVNCADDRYRRFGRKPESQGPIRCQVGEQRYLTLLRYISYTYKTVIDRVWVYINYSRYPRRQWRLKFDHFRKGWWEALLWNLGYRIQLLL